MEFLNLCKLAALLVFFAVKIIRAYVETYDVQKNNKMNSIVADEMLCYCDGKTIKDLKS